MEIQLTKNKYWFWRIVSVNNGQTMLSSETYYSKWNAKRAAKRFAAANSLDYREV